MKPNTTNTLRYEHAIVVGAGIAGLLAARALSDHFSQVTVLDRDALPLTALPRAGIPQGYHLHALLPRGLQVLEAFFPGLSVEMQDAGAIPMDTGADIAWLTPQGWGVQTNAGLQGLSSTRNLLEYTIRRRVEALANVCICHSTEVTGLLRAPTGEITGVRTWKRAGMVEPEEEQFVDLVVIASGRQNTIQQWFAEVWLERPKTTVIDAHIGYASRFYRRKADERGDWQALILQSAPPHGIRGGIMFPMEGDQWLVTLSGGDGDYPPTDDEGFLEFARSLRSLDLYHAIRDAEPLSSIRGFRSTENRQQHFEHIKNWPAGLLVMGDAACAFNPIYGQGMSTASLEAAALSRLLTEAADPTRIGRTFQREVARILRSPWTLATSSDLRFLLVTGARAGPLTRFMHAYIDRVLRLSTVDPWARRRFLEVQGMTREISAVLRPDMLWRILRTSITRKILPAKQIAMLARSEAKRTYPELPAVRKGIRRVREGMKYEQN